MSHRVRTLIERQWIGIIALLIALSMGTAYAANTVFSADIVDGEVRTPDFAASAVTSAKIADQQVKNADLGLGASSSNTIADGGVAGIDIKNNTLTGDDINESTLADSSIVARARGTSVVSVPSSGGAAYPLTNAAWVQPANAVDQLVARFTAVATPACIDAGDARVSAAIFVDGERVGGSEVDPVVTDLVARDFALDVPVFEPGADTPHTVTANVSGDCPNAPSEAPEVTSVSVDVIEFR